MRGERINYSTNQKNRTIMKTRHLTLVAPFAAVLLCTSCDPSQVVLRNNAYLYSQDAEIEVILPSPYGNDTVIHRLSEEFRNMLAARL